MINPVLYQPSVRILGITIQEPVTSATDLLVSLTCFILYRKIANMGRVSKVYGLFKYFFLMMSVSTLLGGLIGHAFLYLFDFGWKIPGWIISMLSIMFIERAAIFHARPVLKPMLGRVLSVVNIVELIIFIILAVATLDFTFVEIHAAYGFLLVVFPLELFIYIKTKDKGSLLMFFVILSAVLSAIIHIKKISPHTWFNHLDLSHVVIMISIILLFKAMQQMYIFEGPIPKWKAKR